MFVVPLSLSDIDFKNLQRHWKDQKREVTLSIHHFISQTHTQNLIIILKRHVSVLAVLVRKSIHLFALHWPVDGVNRATVVWRHHVGVRIQVLISVTQAIDGPSSHRFWIGATLPQVFVIVHGPVFTLLGPPRDCWGAGSEHPRSRTRFPAVGYFWQLLLLSCGRGFVEPLVCPVLIGFSTKVLTFWFCVLLWNNASEHGLRSRVGGYGRRVICPVRVHGLWPLEKQRVSHDWS